MARPSYDGFTVIDIRGLTKSHGDVHAVSADTVRNARGSASALLWAAGAGNTTASATPPAHPPPTTGTVP